MQSVERKRLNCLKVVLAENSMTNVEMLILI